MLKNEIEILREERNKLQQQLYTKANGIAKMLHAFNSDGEDELITFQDLQSTMVNDIYHVNEKVCFIPIKLSKEQLKFITVVEAGGNFGTQTHDIKEYCKILKGHLIEQTDNDREYKVGEIVNYNAYRRHKPKSNLMSIYLVTFNYDEK